MVGQGKGGEGEGGTTKHSLTDYPLMKRPQYRCDPNVPYYKTTSEITRKESGRSLRGLGPLTKVDQVSSLEWVRSAHIGG